MADRLVSFEHGATRWELILPAAPEELIDRESFETDERMPYWADLWPAALALARHLLDAPNLPSRAIELGCGVGLVTMAMLSRGLEVVATDYEPAALRYTQMNAERNELADPELVVLDWRDPTEVEPALLVVAADVLYEARHVTSLAKCVDRLVGRGGRALVADPGRGQRDAMCNAMAQRGWSVTRIDELTVAATAASVLGSAKPSAVQVIQFVPPDSGRRRPAASR